MSNLKQKAQINTIQVIQYL